MGATVTDTGSQTGCGRSWPLCHGNFLPASMRESVIEFSHRAVTGVIGIVIVALAVLSIRIRHRPGAAATGPDHGRRLAAPIWDGRWAVKYPQSAAVLALHFGFSLVAVAGVFLVMRVIDEQSPGRYVEKPPAPPLLKVPSSGPAWSSSTSSRIPAAYIKTPMPRTAAGIGRSVTDRSGRV